MEEREEKRKSRKGLIVLVIVLALLLATAIGYICYDKFFSEEEESVKPTKTEPQEETVEVSQSQILDMVATIPYRENTSSKDLICAYTDKKILSTELDAECYILYAYNKIIVEKENLVLTYSQGMPKYSQSNSGIVSDGGDYEYDSYVKTSDLALIVKDVFNQDISNFPSSISISGGSMYLAGEYYGIILSSGSTTNQKISKVNDFQILDNQVIIKETVGFYGPEDMQGQGFGLYDTDYFTSINYYDGYLDKLQEKALTIGDKDKLMTYFNDNLQKFKTYEHVFTIVDDNFYWNSTSPVV